MREQYLLVDPDPVMNALDLRVVDFTEEDVFKPVAAQNSAMTRIQLEPNAIQQTAPPLRIQIAETKEGGVG